MKLPPKRRRPANDVPLSKGKLREIARAARSVPQRPVQSATTGIYPRWPYFAIGLVALLSIIGTFRSANSRARIPLDPVAEAALAMTNGIAQRIADPGGQFSVPLPPGWAVDPVAKSPYTLVMRSANGPSVSLLSTNVHHSDLARLTDAIRRREAASGIATEMDAQRLGRRTALARRATLVYERVLAVDFVEAEIACHMMCAAPTNLFSMYEPVFLRLAEEIRVNAATKAAVEPRDDAASGIPGNS